MKHPLALFTLLLSAALVLPNALRADPLPEAIKIHPSGSFERGGVRVGIVHFEAGWKGYRHQRDVAKPLPGFPYASDGVWTMHGKFHTLFDLRQTMEVIGPDSIRYEASVSAEQPINTATLALEVYLTSEAFAGKEILIDGVPFVLPAQQERVRLFEQTPVRSLGLTTADGPLRFEGPFSLYIQDNRGFRTKPGFVAQIRFTPYGGLIKESALKTVVHLK